MHYQFTNAEFSLKFRFIIGVNASPRLDGEAAFKLNAQCAHGPVYWCKNLM